VTFGRDLPAVLGSAVGMASTTQKRRTPARPRRQPQQSNVQKAFGRLPTGKKATPTKSSRGGTAGKAAMLTAVAGFAFKNRQKITGMLGKRKAADPKI
jgi:hypothetical protein